MNTRIIIAAGMLAGTAGLAHSGTTYFATSGSTLYRVTDGSVETFQLDHELNALSFDANGRLFGTAKDDTNSDGSYELVEIVNPFGAGLAGLSRGDFLEGDTSSLALTGDAFSGFDKTNGQLVDINTGLMTTAPRGPLQGGVADTPGSSAYDAINDILYGIKGDALYTIAENAGSYELTQTATLSGGVSGKIGGEWFDGEYYHAINDGDSYHVYTVDLVTGALTEVLSWRVDSKGSAGFAVAVPAPATLALLGVGTLGMARRRGR